MAISMKSPSGMILFLLLPLHFLYIKETYECNRQTLTQDSIVIAKSNKALVINDDNIAASIHVKANKQQLFTKNKRYCLLMDGLQLKQLPEGAYEMYLTPADNKTENLTPESIYFINVLDTYTLGSTQGAKYPCLDVTNQLYTQNGNNNQLIDYQVTVLFKGNMKSDSTTARNAGVLIIDSIKLIQTD